MHSELHFKIKHLIIDFVSGKFNHLIASAEAADDNFQDGKLTFEAKVISNSTNNADRDKYLLSFVSFDVEKYPVIDFQSTSF